jgi:hypothetical protein
MEIQIGEMNSTVRATDSAALLSPQLLEVIVRATLARLQEIKAQEKSTEADRHLRQGVFKGDPGGRD